MTTFNRAECERLLLIECLCSSGPVVQSFAIQLRAALTEIDRLEQERRIVASQTNDQWAHDALRSRYVGGHDQSHGAEE